MWSRRSKTELPSVYILIKRKKKWSKARCIVQYHRFFLGKALKAAGRILTTLCSFVYKDNTFNCSTVDGLLRQVTSWNSVADQLYQVLAHNHDVQVDIHADDLVGFFPSVDQQDMLDCATYTLEAFCQARNATPAELIISVPLQAACQCFSGKYDGEESHRPFFLEYLLPLLRFSLEASLINYKGKAIRQHRGGPIGSPCSPPWLVMCVCRAEYNWLNSLQPPLSLRGKWWQTSRYVDNKSTVSLCVDGHVLAPSSLFLKGFYGKAVELELEEKNRLCGAEILKFRAPSGATLLSTRYFVEGFPDRLSPPFQLDEELQWKYRTPNSGSTRTSLMSAFNARLHLCKRLSSSRPLCQQAICRLCTVYLLLGYPGEWLSRCIGKFISGHYKDAEQEWIHFIIRATKRCEIQEIHSRGK